jgi:hypothetical protein
LLNRRLQRLRADEHSLKATIGELVTATEIAERAIGGLKLTVRDCDSNLGGRLASASELGDRLSQQIMQGEDILRRLSRIAMAARPSGQSAAAAAPASTAQNIAIAAQALVERNKVRGVAA